MNYIYGILIFGVGAAIGVKVGLNIQTNTIREHLACMAYLSEKIKTRNNQFLTNYLDLYHKSNDCEGEFTDIDEYTMDMWID